MRDWRHYFDQESARVVAVTAGSLATAFTDWDMILKTLISIGTLIYLGFKIRRAWLNRNQPYGQPWRNRDIREEED